MCVCVFEWFYYCRLDYKNNVFFYVTTADVIIKNTFFSFMRGFTTADFIIYFFSGFTTADFIIYIYVFVIGFTTADFMIKAFFLYA